MRLNKSKIKVLAGIYLLIYLTSCGLDDSTSRVYENNVFEDPYVLGIIESSSGLVLDYVDREKVDVLKFEDNKDPRNILSELIYEAGKFRYVQDQNLPYYDEMNNIGANCQAFSLWLSVNLDNHGIENHIDVTEGITHAFNVVVIGDSKYKIDLSRKEIEDGYGI